LPLAQGPLTLTGALDITTADNVTAWHVILSVNGSAGLHPLAFENVLAVTAGLAIAIPGDDGDFHFDPASLVGLPADWQSAIDVLESGGVWSSSAWITAEAIGMSGRTTWFGRTFLHTPAGRTQGKPPATTAALGAKRPGLCVLERAVAASGDTYSLEQTCGPEKVNLPGFEADKVTLASGAL